MVLAAIGPFVLCDRPADARWLSPDERRWLQDRLNAERHKSAGRGMSILHTLRSPCVVLLAVAYTAIGFGVYANVFFLPLIIKDLGFSNIVVSYLAAMPAALGAAGMILVSRSSDRTGERMLHVTVPTLLAALGLIATGLSIGNPVAELIALCVVGFCDQCRAAHLLESADRLSWRRRRGGGHCDDKLDRQHLRLSRAATGGSCCAT